MGVRCIVFDIDGMLFDFFMNFLNIEKKKLRIFFSKFHVFFTFHAISNIKKKLIWCKKKIRGGGGVSRFMLFSTLKKIILKSAPDSRWGQLEFNIHYILYSLVLILYLKCGGGLGRGGVMFFSHVMLFPTFLEQISGNTNQLFLI